MNAAERVRRRVRELIEERGYSQKTVAEAIGHTQSWMSQFLAGSLQLGMDELDAVALALGSTAVELIRDPEQFQYCADLTPSEMAMLRRVRRLGPSIRDAVQLIVQAVAVADVRSPKGALSHVGSSPATPTELYHAVSHVAAQLNEIISAEQAESRRQAASSRPALTAASRSRRGRRGRVLETPQKSK